ncbi:MAG: hypothetical protein K6G85_08930 [Eubacterium sp.]|nr:hypothetical protein [Eubacterium sp.]
MRYKKLILGLLSTVVLGTSFSVPSIGIMADNATKSEVKEFKLGGTITLKSIQLKWKKQDNAAYYKVYRVKYKHSKNNKFPKKSKYKKIATVKSANFKNKKSVRYSDKKVKLGVEYAYYINSYSKDKKLLGTSFRKDCAIVGYSGVGTPNLASYLGDDLNSYVNSPKKLRINIERGMGVAPSGYIIYRKTEGDKKYKKVTTLKAENEYYYESFLDKTVKGGKTYYYKAKAFYKADKKTYYSKMSKKLKLMAVNFVGSYAANYLGTKNNEITFSWTSKKYNANTVVKKTLGTIYFDGTEKDGLGFNLTQYSFDNKTWKSIPDKGVTIKAGKTVYFKGTSEIPKGYTAEKATIEFGDKDIFYNSGKTVDYTFTLDFSKKQATAMPDWD